MELSFYANSQAFFEISSGPELIQLNTLKERGACLKDFLKKMAILPFALGFKALKTGFRVCGLMAAGLFLLFTCGATSAGRKFFVERVSLLAKDLADWVLFPFAVLVCFARLLLAFAIHPDLYFKN